MKKSALLFPGVLVFLSVMILAQERKLQVKKWITITSPKAGDEFKESDPVKVTWSSEGVTGMLKASFYKYQQGMVQTYARDLQPKGSLTVPPGRIRPGQYFIRFEEVDGSAKANSGVFSIVLTLDKPAMIKKEPQTIEVTIPVQKRDRHSKRSQYEQGEFPTGEKVPNSPTHLSMPDKARVGFENHYWKDGTGWSYRGFVYRSRLFFDVSQFVGKKEILLEARLKLINFSTDSNYSGTSSCEHF